MRGLVMARREVRAARQTSLRNRPGSDARPVLREVIVFSWLNFSFFVFFLGETRCSIY